MTKPNGEEGRNTEILRIKDNNIVSVEVYFGWDVSPDTFDHQKASHK